MGADHAADQDLAVALRIGRIVNSSLATPSSRPLEMARPDAIQGNRPFLTLMPWAMAWSSERPTQATLSSV